MKKSNLFQQSKLPATIVIALLGACGMAHGQTRSWTTTVPDGDSGNWSDTAEWIGADVPDTAAENASFGAYANGRVITLNGDFTIGSLTITPRNAGFTGQSFSLQLPAVPAGTEIIRLNGGLTVDNGNTAAVSVPIEVAANQIWTALSLPAGSANFTGVVSGAGKITRSAGNTGSVFTFTGANTFAGGFQQTAANSPTTRLGTSTVIGGGAVTTGPLGLGTVTLDGGTLASNGGTSRTLNNDIVVSGSVNFGILNSTGALTFSDATLTTPTSFTLGSATANAVTTVRSFATNVTIDQVIAESGGANQSVLFSSVSGTPTIILNRTKTAGGQILSSGVNLVLANNAAQSGAMSGFGGSITATGANKFSSGALIADGTSLVATDLANFSAIAGGTATVFNNGRVSFATDQTQAALAALFTSDSLLRLGLGSGAISATVTENYNQSGLGIGRAGLVSANTATITYTGTLVAGSDNTFRVGGGLGTLAFTGSTLAGAGRSVIVEGGGTLSLTGNQTYDGSTIINSTVTLSGLSGALSATSGVTVNAGATLNLTNNTAAENPNRLGNTVGLTLNNGIFSLNGTSTTAITETIGNLTINSGGRNFFTVATTPAAATVKTLQFGTLTRANNALAVFRGDALGTTAAARNEIKFSAPPALIGGGGAAGSNTISLIPWARGGTTSTSPAITFATYEANGVRVLNTTTEFLQANDNSTARIDQAIATAGGGSNYNVRSIPNTTGSATLVNTASSSVTVNSLLLDNTAATAANTYGLNSSTLNVTSGAVHIQHAATQNITLGTGTLAFGSAEGVITSNNGGFLTAINTQITGTGGLSVYSLNGGGTSLGSVTTAGYSGGFTIGGNGYVAVDQDQRFGNPANSITHAGGELRFFAGFTTVRDLILLGGVGDNTLGNSSTFTHTWNGNISGDGRLRLINSATTTSAVGFVLGGANTYTGGTVIESINVTASSNTAFGTGPLSLLGSSVVTLTGTAPVLGGLRGGDGRITLNPAGSAATLEVGSANQSGFYAGVITQGAGKTASLTKTGTGTLILGARNSYTGTTTVSAGTLAASEAWFDDASTVSIASTGTLRLTHTATDVVGAFKIDGVAQPAGEYGALLSGAQFTTARITGTGRIQSLGLVTDPYESYADSFGLVGSDRDKSADPDKDGLTNLAEFATDGNPASGTASGKLRSQVETVGGAQALILTIAVRDGAVFDNIPGPAADANVDGVLYTIQGSNDLAAFNQGVTEIAVSSSGLPSLSAGYSYRTFRLNGNIDGVTPRGPAGFLRAQFQTAP